MTIIEPSAIARLPHDRFGRPIPWFVTTAKEDGDPDFRIVDPERIIAAYARRVCFLCGGRLTRHAAFAVGPMCTVNRTSQEPPNHIDCAEYAVKASPFLANPRMRRNEKDLPKGVGSAGIMIERNPGVIAVWITNSWYPFSDGRGGQLFRMGNPSEVRWYREGRPATREEVVDSVQSGMPLLEREARSDPRPRAALQDLIVKKALAETFFPAHGSA